ncbi:MAG: GIY-YIG nuclease family protein [Candidatus Helarchaeota archaeon]|nr:GIY-YIG nuclease family protein [Candidatus Helarchaeota archaeon]
MGQFYVYIVKCEKDNSFYTGYTNNLEKRISQHNRGIGSKYTRSRGPVELQYYEIYNTRKWAMRREREIKKFSRKTKIQLIKRE